MAEGNTEQVTNSTDNFDIAAIAEELGIKTAPPAAPAAEEEKTEPDASADTGDQQPETGRTPESADDETESEDPTEDVAEDKEEDEKPESQDQEPEAPDKIQRRIDRITAEKHELREERDSIKAELEALRKQAEAKPPIVTIEPDNPLSSLTDASALQAEIDKAQAVLDWADDNRDGGSVTIAGEEKFYDADAVKQIKANAKSLLRNAPKQQDYLKLREGLLPAAQAAYPELFQQGTVPKAYLDASLKAYPWLTRFPGYELIVGDAFVGQNMREAREQQQQRKLSGTKASKSPAPAAAKVMKTPSPGARPKVSGSEAALRHKAAAVFKSPGNADALADYLEAIV